MGREIPVRIRRLIVTDGSHCLPWKVFYEEHAASRVWIGHIQVVQVVEKCLKREYVICFDATSKHILHETLRTCGICSLRAEERRAY